MAVINFPDAPITGDRFTLDEITYEYQSEGFWKSVASSVGNYRPSEFALYLNSVPTDATETLYRIDLFDGQTLDIASEYAFGLIGNNPVSDQVYDVYVNEVKATDTITISSAGALTLSLPRAPFTDALTLKVKVSESTTIDALFDGFGLISEVYTV